MSPSARPRVVLLAACLAWPGAGWAQALTVASLQRLLQEAPKPEVRFTESRESPWLAAPLQSSGTMKMTATMLEKRIEQPRRETWRILPDRMQLVATDAATTKEFLFRDAPAVASLATAMRDVMAGNLTALENDFQTVVSGDERLWTVRLTPRRPELARALKQLDLQGSQGRLQVFVILEAQGDRTTTRIVHD